MPTKILIVDDEPDMEVLIRQRFRRQIREGVYEFLFAPDGAEALKVLRTGGGVELVLTDINMPVMDGLTLLRQLHDFRPRVGAVIVSAYGDMSNIRTAMNLGALDFLTKPIDFQDFERTVEKTLAQVRELVHMDRDRLSLAAVERDLETAAEIQRSFLPSSDPGEEYAVRLHAIMAPARAVGGDFYDYFALDRARVGLVIGDVTGKGVPAALFMAVTRTLLRGTAPHCSDPADCLRLTNWQLMKANPAARFVSIWYGILDTSTGELVYSVAGHPGPFIVRAGGAVEPLEGRGMLVGVMKEPQFETLRVQLESNDLLFLYTDGVTEARGADGALFTAAQLGALLQVADRSTPQALVQDVMTSLGRFVDGAPQADDITMMAVLASRSGGEERQS